MSADAIRIIFELFVIVTIVLYASYIGALVDIKLIQRRARKQAELERTMNILKRK